MRKLLSLAIAVLNLSGCYSYVKTYDGRGNLIAECNSGGMALGFIPVWGFAPVPPCTGSANPLAQTNNQDLGVKVTHEPMSCPEGKELRGMECYPTTSAITDMMKARPR